MHKMVMCASMISKLYLLSLNSITTNAEFDCILMHNRPLLFLKTMQGDTHQGDTHHFSATNNNSWIHLALQSSYHLQLTNLSKWSFITLLKSCRWLNGYPARNNTIVLICICVRIKSFVKIQVIFNCVIISMVKWVCKPHGTVQYPQHHFLQCQIA